MEKSVKQRQKIKSIILISIIGIIIGALFAIVAFGLEPVRIIKGVIAGFLITFIIGVLEFFVFQKQFNKLKFSIILLIRTVCYVIAISISVITVWVIHESSVNDESVFTTLSGSDFKHFMVKGDFPKILVFAIIVGFLINFFTQINSLLGKNVLWNYLTGKYHNPKEEERVFMFLDLSSSTTIAEKLSPINYHKFMNNYFFDIDEEIVKSKGEIYQYVGDEVVISWRDDNGFKNANCIRCFFNIRKRIDDLSESYEKQFGVIPGFKAGLHCGNVVTGEIGDSKKEIVFHGDVLNTASRIQSECNKQKKNFLVSEDVLIKLTLPDEYKSVNLGEFMLRGKAQQVEIFSIEKL
jgi:adenylate cyclase